MTYIKDWVEQGTKDIKYYCSSCDKEISFEDWHADKLCQTCRDLRNEIET